MDGVMCEIAPGPFGPTTVLAERLSTELLTAPFVVYSEIAEASYLMGSTRTAWKSRIPLTGGELSASPPYGFRVHRPFDPAFGCIGVTPA